MGKRFLMCFQLSKMIMFEVEYEAITGHEYFSTSSSKFIKSKRDYEQCGQSQETLLPHFTVVNRFYKKWDSKHLKALNDSEYQELLRDIQLLKDTYNYIEKGESFILHYIPFYEIQELSKQVLKRHIIKEA